MTTVWNPNLLAVAGLIITACGLGLLAKGLLSAVSSGASARHVAAKTRVDLGFAAPMLILGLVVLASAQFVSAGPTPAITSLLLAAAFGLLLYGLIESSLVESMVAIPEATSTKLKLIAPPASQMAPVPEVVVAAVDTGPAERPPTHAIAAKSS